MNTTPYDATNSTNPWLMNKKSTPIIGPENLPLTAENIWSKQGQDRIDLVDWIFNYYRTKGFPYFKLTDQELFDEFQNLKSKDPNIIFDGQIIKNSNTAGLNIAKHFTSELFYASREKTGKSCIDVFNDDELFKKVLQNRMGFCTSKEDGTERPYIFAIDDDMILQGFRSSKIGGASSISHFKPMIAKYIYAKYNTKKTLDFSCGWSARCVAALSLGIEYYGIDPLTAEKINETIKYFGGTGKCIKDCSESADYSVFPQVDLCFSCCPYFNIEIYSNDTTQSSNYGDYQDWLDKYWKATVLNCYQKTNYFGFVAMENVRKFSFLADLMKICSDCGGVLVEDTLISAARSHLSGKKKSGQVNKKTEHLVVYKVR